MDTLIIPVNVRREITRIVRAIPDGLETGVTLFGVTIAEASDPEGPSETHSQFVVLSVAGPGRRAVHQPAHYAVDHEHASSVYAALGCALPGIRWLGELHLHPPGMTWLSGGDHRTIRAILTGADGEVPPEEMIAGVMQRNRRIVELYPFHFRRPPRRGRAMTIFIVDPASPLIDEARAKALRKEDTQPANPKGVADEPILATESRPDLRAEPCAGGTPREKASRFRWLWKRWRFFNRDGRARRGGTVHAD
jgi:hypothetical protein